MASSSTADAKVTKSRAQLVKTSAELAATEPNAVPTNGRGTTSARPQGAPERIGWPFSDKSCAATRVGLRSDKHVFPPAGSHAHVRIPIERRVERWWRSRVQLHCRSADLEFSAPSTASV